MDIEKLIEQLNDWNEKYISNLCGDRTIKCEEYCIKDDCLIVKAATALSTLQAENEKLWADVVRFNDMLASYQNVLVPELRAELEQVKQELDAAKSPEVLEAVDELMEFARTRMSTADWLYYVDVLGEWRGQKED